MPRPKSFDPDTALDRAMQVFWDKGYECASIQDLTEAMGINRFSLYDTFGDKHALFLKALDRYANRFASEHIARIDACETLDDLADLLAQNAHHPSEQDHAGCMLARCAAEEAGKDPSVADRFNAGVARTRLALERALKRFKEQGQLADHVSIPAAACMLLALAHGVISLNNSDQPTRTLRASIKLAVSSLRP